MTVIAFCADTNRILVDQQHTYFNGKKPFLACKIQTLGDFQYAMSGSTKYDYILRENLAKVLETDKHVDVDVEANGIEGLVRKADGSVWIFNIDDAVLRVNPIALAGQRGHGWATGSGGDWFYAYFSAGLGSVEDCIKLVALHHTTCGGDIDQF